MALVYPRTLPGNVGWTDCEFNIVDNAKGSRKKSGAVPRLITGVPYWEARWTTEPISRIDYYRIRAWFDSLGGGEKTFYGYDVGRKYPGNYHMASNGWGSWDGEGDVSAIGSSSITVAGCLADLALLEGDKFEIRNGTKRHVHMVTEAVTLDGTGAGEIFVRPFPLTLVYPSPYTTYSVHFLAPSCEFIIDRTSWSGKPPAGDDKSPVSFAADQMVPT